MKHYVTAFFVAFLFPIITLAQHTAMDSVAMYHESTAINSGKIQQELIYLHLDNTSYYRGDRMYFACYLMTAGRLEPSQMSRTVYVELLNPGGKIIDRCVLKPDNGCCHGSLLVDEMPFYSGYYEIRAYTRYMLNFGPQAIYSRVVPVFFAPEQYGNWADRRVMKYGSARREYNRPKPVARDSRDMWLYSKTLELKVDTVASADSVSFILSRGERCGSDVFGISLMCRGELCGRAILDLTDADNATFAVSRHRLPAGVIQATAFDASGVPLADCLFFNPGRKHRGIEYHFNKECYAPYELVELEVRAPEPGVYALSVADAENHVAKADDMRDEIMRRQGWRRYSWPILAGMEELQMDMLPEQGIEVRGRVVGSMRNRGKDDVTVSMLLNHVDSIGEAVIEEFRTDSLGRFAFQGDLKGQWMMSLSATENEKKTRHRVLLDRIEYPQPRGYYLDEMQFEIADLPEAEVVLALDSVDEDGEFLRKLARSGVKQLHEVEITADGGHAEDVRKYMENSVTSYDVAGARQLLQDQGIKMIRRLKDILPLIDSNFLYRGGEDKLYYRAKEPIFVIDDAVGGNELMVRFSDIDAWNALDLSVDMIKNIYINNETKAISEYGIKMFENNLDLLDYNDTTNIMSFNNYKGAAYSRSLENRDYHSEAYQDIMSKRFGCVVFVELNTHRTELIRPGMRRAIVDGYTNCEEFVMPDYSRATPFDPDFRRTLYWNPSVETDEQGVAYIRFYNNSTARRFVVSLSGMKLL